MKRIALIAFALLFIVFAACKKTSGPADGNSVQPNNNLDSLVSMSATINGTLWQTDSAFGYKVRSSANDSTVVNLIITAVRKDNGNPSTITFNIVHYNGLAKYTIAPPAVTATYYIGTERHFATYGDINVVSNSNYSLIGNFYFVADGFSVNGDFNVALP
jgi:hypothetical protein